ncbi:MAG TPA: hypothetical protein VM238_20820 [Phycisphaerae bacterium]|nr:hypothetical protein [Phycisphaerae bacterium]
MQFQFGEILTLGLCAVTAAYLLGNRRTIQALRALRPFVVPFLLMATAWTATVLEGIPSRGEGATIIFWEESADVARAGGFASELLNLLEHIGYATAGVWLLVVLWRAFRTPREALP